MYVGDDLTYTIVVTNHGPDTAHGVTLTDPLDADLSFVSTDHAGVEAAGVVTWNLGDIASGDAVTVGLVVGALAARTDLPNTATAASTTPDTDPSNDAGTALIDTQEHSIVSADLQVAKTVDVDRPTSGEVVTYTVTVTNGDRRTPRTCASSTTCPPASSTTRRRRTSATTTPRPGCGGSAPCRTGRRPSCT